MRTMPAKTKAPARKYDDLEIRRAAAEEGVDPRSVKKRLGGEEVRGLAGARADRAIEKLRKKKQ